MKEYERDSRIDGYEMWLRVFVFVCDNIALWTYMKSRDVFIAGDCEPARNFDAFGNI